MVIRYITVIRLEFLEDNKYEIIIPNKIYDGNNENLAVSSYNYGTAFFLWGVVE